MADLFRESILGKPSYSGADIRVYAINRSSPDNADAISALKDQIHFIRTSIADDEIQLAQQQADAHLLEQEVAKLELEQKNDIHLIPLTELQTLSISIYRDKVPVRGLGSTYARGFARGQRSLAGSMIFTTFDEHVLAKLLRAGGKHQDVDLNKLTSTTLSDQLPPFDLMIQFANEFGDAAEEVIYGVEFMSEGHTLSIEDLLLENVMQWQAIDIDLMRNVRTGKFTPTHGVELQESATSLLKKPDMRRYLQRASGFDGFTAYTN